eukprot:15357940-Ditylum_brightwellii.AAC.2
MGCVSSTIVSGKILFLGEQCVKYPFYWNQVAADVKECAARICAVDTPWSFEAWCEPKGPLMHKGPSWGSSGGKIRDLSRWTITSAPMMIVMSSGAASVQ